MLMTLGGVCVEWSCVQTKPSERELDVSHVFAFAALLTVHV